MFDVAQPAPARLLIVDDNPVSRKKLKLAVENLGHTAETVVNGEAGLEAIGSTAFDAVLLDMLMPGIDGFDVLRQLKADDTLRDMPVIVVSSLEDDVESVSRAITLGAEDFLPKEFDPVILNARLQASLQKKRFRETEREYFGRIDALTDAAAKVESGHFDSKSLKLQDLASHADPIGRLAAVFEGMADEIYNRELKLKRRVSTLQGILLVIVSGLIWGLVPALSRLSSEIGSNPLGLTVWVNAIAASICLSVAFARGKLPRLAKHELVFFLAWAFLAGVLQRITIFVLAEQVEATLLSLVAALQGFMVFVIAAVTKLERASPRRSIGLAIGLVGITVTVLLQYDLERSAETLWISATVLVPLLSAIESMALAGRRPTHVDHFASTGVMFGLSLLFVVPLALLTGDTMPWGEDSLKQAVVVGLLGLATALSGVTFFILVATAGAVFASQAAYSKTLAGIVWGMLLLGEEIKLTAWAGIALVIVGMYLVEPRHSDEKIIIKRRFR